MYACYGVVRADTLPPRTNHPYKCQLFWECRGQAPSQKIWIQGFAPDPGWKKRMRRGMGLLPEYLLPHLLHGTGMLVVFEANLWAMPKYLAD